MHQTAIRVKSWGMAKDYKEDERTENLFTPDNNFDFLKHFIHIFLKNHSTEP